MGGRRVLLSLTRRLLSFLKKERWWKVSLSLSLAITIFNLWLMLSIVNKCWKYICELRFVLFFLDRWGLVRYYGLLFIDGSDISTILLCKAFFPYDQCVRFACILFSIFMDREFFIIRRYTCIRGIHLWVKFWAFFCERLCLGAFVHRWMDQMWAPFFHVNIDRNSWKEVVR